MTENVWDYPRPPRMEPVASRVRIVLGGETIADTTDAYRILETSHPPTFYVPPGAFVAGAVRDAAGTSLCEWKGRARYHDLVGGGRTAERAGWSYAAPTRAYRELADHVSVYPSRVDACFVGEEQVQAQEGDFYGGWITRDLEGPFKGPPGTRGW